MSQIKLDSLAAVAPLEPMPTDPAAAGSATDALESFDVHLERAQASPPPTDHETQPVDEKPRDEATEAEPQETDEAEPADPPAAESADNLEEKSGDSSGGAAADDENDRETADEPPLTIVAVEAELPATETGKSAEGVAGGDEPTEPAAESEQNRASRVAKSELPPAAEESELVDGEGTADKSATARVASKADTAEALQTAQDGSGTARQDAEPQPQRDVAAAETRPRAEQPAAAANAAVAPNMESTSPQPSPNAPAADTPPAIEELSQPTAGRALETTKPTTEPSPAAAPENPAEPPPRATGHQAAPAGTPQRASQTSAADRVRFVQRVARAFEAMGNRNGSVRLRLSPPELGSLRVEISVRSGAMSAHVEADNATARNLLLDNLPALRDRLAQLDIKVERFDVELADHMAGGLSERAADQPHSGDDGDGRPAGGNAGCETDAEAENIVPAAVVNRPGEGTQLNVIV